MLQFLERLKKHSLRKNTTLILPVLISLYINQRVLSNNYSPTLVFWWLLSIALLIFPFVLESIKRHSINFKLSKKLILLLLITSLPTIVRITNYQPNRIHGDDLMAAYFSATQDFPKINFFSGIPTLRTDWESQFPSPFFILQKIFFIFFGVSLLSVKLSIIPYVFIVTIMIFLITKFILNEKVAAIAIFLYSLFAINLYLETIGLWVVSGTAVFLVFFYFLICNFKKNTTFDSVFMGIFSGFSYLFYFNSYIAFPLMVLAFLTQLLIVRKWYVISNFLISFVGFAIVISPFFTYAATFDNYFRQRMDQVSLLTGAWSVAAKEIKQGKNPISLIKENALLSIRSLYESGIGGQGGVTFAKLALFEKLSLSLFILGMLIGPLLMLRKVELIFVFLVILLSLFQMILSIPPPAYHRFALAFPFLSIVCALPFYALLSTKKLNMGIKYVTTLLLLVLYGITNQRYFFTSVSNEKYHPILYVSEYINKHFPNRNIYVAAYPGFSFDKIYYFSRGKNAKKIHTDYHEALLKNYIDDEKYVYVILFPEEFNGKFMAANKNGNVINVTKDFSLFVN